MTFENIAEIGDSIRVFDFQPGTDRGDCYIEGVVVAKHRKIGRYEAIPHSCFVVEVAKDVWNSKPSPARLGETIYVPYEVTITEWDGRISKVETGKGNRKHPS